MTLEMGKPIAESKAEIAYAANFFRWYTEEAVRINGRFTVNETGAGRVLTMQQPVGPCVFITPWNFPLAMGTRKVGPAIAAGCTMVVKPAKQTPLSMLAMAQILEEAGLPAGVLNVITAKSSGSVMEPIIKDPRTRKLSFTGSTEVGKKLIEQSAEQVLRVSMELGGNAPFLVFEDADLDAAVEGALIAKMRNGGEACTSANRFHVAESVAGDFAERLAARLGELKVGRGTDDGSRSGRSSTTTSAGRSRSSWRTPRARARRSSWAAGAWTGPATSTRRPSSRTCPTAPGCCARRSSARWRRSRASAPRTRPSRPPTTPSTAWSPTSTRRTSRGPSGSSSGSRRGWSASTRAWSPTRARPSAGSSSPATAARAAPRGMREYLETKYVAMNV